MVFRQLRIPLIVGCILHVLAVATFATEFSYHLYQTDINISADTNSALIKMGKHSFNLKFPSDVGDPQECDDDEICIGWGYDNSPKLMIHKHKPSKHSMWRVQIDNTAGAKLSIELNGDYLYGGPVLDWPSNKNQINDTPYISGMDNTGPVAERYWFTSSGLAVNIDADSHLFVSQSSKKLDLNFKNSFPYTSTSTAINSFFCLGDNAKDAFACFPQTNKITERNMIKYPVWSTWVQFRSNYNQDKIIKFADDLQKYGLGISTIEIDAKWETCFGALEWDKNKIPDPRGMINELNSHGINVTLWVTPHICTDCKIFNFAKPYLYKLPNGEVGTTTWNGQAGLIDFTNQDAVEWYKKRLQALKDEYGVVGFKLIEGESSLIPSIQKGYSLMADPNEQTRGYNNMAASFGPMGQIESGSQNSNAAIFQSIRGTNSNWEKSKIGLRSVIPAVLSLNALGYTAIMPDMVGGNQYGVNCTKELFIRWAQLNTFLPVMEFSLAPWNFDEETVEITRMLISLHAKYAEKIIREIEEGQLEDGHRVISPVWWHSPNDKTALKIDNEFLLGTDILVAPVVEEKVYSRDVYLPDGKWQDPLKISTYIGPTTIKNYPAPLDVIPYFIRVSE